VLNLPATRRTNQRWQSVGQRVGLKHIGQAGESTPYILVIFLIPSIKFGCITSNVATDILFDVLPNPLFTDDTTPLFDGRVVSIDVVRAPPHEKQHAQPQYSNDSSSIKHLSESSRNAP
jgi:hypothetical protein